MAPPANDDVVNATLVTTSTTLSGTTVDATYEVQEGEHGFDQPSVWYRVELAPAETALDLYVPTSDYPWGLDTWIPDVDPPSGFDDVFNGTHLSALYPGGGVLHLTGLPAGSVVYVYISDQPFDGTTGNFDLQFAPGGGIVPPPPPPNSVTVLIDGTDVTGCSLRGAWTPRLNRPAQVAVTLPMDCAIGDVGSRLQLLINSTLVFHGFVLTTETDTDKDGGTTIYTAQDPMELWQWRPVRDDGGDFSKPDINNLNGATLTGPSMMEAMLINTVSAGAGPPVNAEGEIFLDMGSFAGGGVDLTGAPVDWPMTIAQLTSLLMSTGQLDVVITPTDPGGGVMGTVDAYNGDFGTDLSGSITFSYGMGDRNVDSLRWNRDMTSIVNKYWLYGGPRIKSAADPAGDQHWCFNITGFDFALAYPPGGVSVDAFNVPVGPPWTDDQLGERIYNSRATSGPNGTGYGVRMKIDIFDAYDDDCIPGFGTVGRDLYRRQWQEFSWIMAMPREIIHITPTRDTEIGTFNIGDLVTVEATSEVRGGFSGVQRIYEYTISWEGPDSVLSLGELQTSSDAEF